MLLKVQYNCIQMSRHWRKFYDDELERINRFLNQKPAVSRHEDTFYTHEAIDKIKQKMHKLGSKYRFSNIYLEPEEMDDQHRNMKCVRRKIKIRFRCKNNNCPSYKQRTNSDQRPGEHSRRWTSYYGLVDYKFFFNHLLPLNPKPRLIHSFQLYRQRCQECNQWGKSGLIDSILEELINLYSLLVQNFMVMRHKPQLISWGFQERIGCKGNSYIADQKQHIQQLCEACSLGKCKRSRTDFERQIYDQLR